MMPPTVVEPPSANPTIATAIRMGPATTISLLQFKTCLLSLMYSVVSLSCTTPATFAISLSISALHPLSIISSSVLEGVAAALLGHHIAGFISEGNFSSMVGFVDGQHLSHGIIQKLRKLWVKRGVKVQCGLDVRVKALEESRGFPLLLC
ncbi:hypothetical protein AMTRI_Chr08g162770 [Amborella trichopoda]